MPAPAQAAFPAGFRRAVLGASVYLVAIAAIAWAVYLARDEEGENAATGIAIAVVAINVLALVALSLEIHDFFQQQIDTLYRGNGGSRVPNYYGRAYYEQFAHANKLRDFAYKSNHAKVFRDRPKWFEKMDKPSHCLWWIPAGHIPIIAQGRERLEHYQKHGATPYSFRFSQHFPQPADEGVCA